LEGRVDEHEDEKRLPWSWVSLSVRGPRWHTIRLPLSSTRTSPSILKGTVTKIEWSNPHTYFYIDVTMPDAK